jgi:hypothetical protein
MAPLRNHKHEAFAQNLVLATKHGWSNGSCYSRAGYNSEGESAEVCASKLLSNAKANIPKRVQEIMQAGVKRAATTVESLLGELDDVLAAAVDDKQFGAARGCIDSKARLKGLFLDRVEVGGPNEFRADLTIESVAEDMIEQLGGGDAALALSAFDEMMGQVRTVLEGHAAARATTVERRAAPTSEAAIGLAMLQRRPKGRPGRGALG